MVVDYVEHNHDPKVMNSYGLAVERTLSDTPTDVEGAANFDHAMPSQHGTPSLHAISRLSARDFEDDFADTRLMGKLHSSPFSSRTSPAGQEPGPSCVLRPSDNNDAAAFKLTTILMVTSEVDARGYQIRKFIARPRTAPDDAEDPLSHLDPPASTLSQ